MRNDIENKKKVLVSVKQILTNYLELNNRRKTPERYAILEAIYNMDGHFTLDELGDELIGKFRFPVSRATLYNTIRLFLELRLVIRHHFEGITKYEACYDDNSHSHQICTVCGKVTEIKSRTLERAIEEIKLPRFRKDGFSLYLYGVCTKCQNKISKNLHVVNDKK